MKHILLFILLFVQTLGLATQYHGTHKSEAKETLTQDQSSNKALATNYLGTPVQAYDSSGEKVWECALDIYGKAMTVEGEQGFVPFRYQGQYEDQETGLYYNRFRYYSADSGTYISQDPIRLRGSNANFYAYTRDTNIWIDLFGLTGTYIFTDGNTSYIGKGPESRMGTSMKQRLGGNQAIASTHVDFGDDDMGLMVEHKLMEDYDAKKSEVFANSDRISSPGKKKYNAASPEVRAKVDAEAAKIKADFEGQKTKVNGNH